jgi:predicted NBD/HSP70 family sugar kinase
VTTMKNGEGLLSPSRIGQVNRSRVLELLHQEGPSSRAQLARALGVNRATIASILQPLIDSGTLVEGEQVSASPAGGKPARPLWFNRDGNELGSMRVAPRSVAAARLGMDGTVHHRTRREVVPEDGLEAVQAVLLAVAEECFREHPVLGIGIGSSGMVDTTAGTIVAMNLAPVMNGFPLGPLLAERFQVPVAIDHHPRVQALGDKWFGQGRSVPSFASVYTGEALGMGIVHDRQIVRGPAGAGGEYGHMVIDMNGDVCMCGRRGCWETVASLAWLRREAVERGLPDNVDCGRLASAADSGDAAALELLDLYARNLAIGMANNEHMIASGTYIVHGDAARGGQRMQEALARWLTTFEPHRETGTSVLLGSSDDESTLLGGGGLVLSTLLGVVA